MIFLSIKIIKLNKEHREVIQLIYQNTEVIQLKTKMKLHMGKIRM